MPNTPQWRSLQELQKLANRLGAEALQVFSLDAATPTVEYTWHADVKNRTNQDEAQQQQETRLLRDAPPLVLAGTPQHLVLKGFYRHVRNPMYLAVVAVILGEAMILGNVQLLGYCALVWLFCHLFVLAYEEPTLRKTFGGEYDAFCANVPRWIPRLSPWNMG